MPDIDKLTREPNLEFRRDRRIELSAAGSPPAQPKKDARPRIAKQRQNFIDVSDKALSILAAASKLAITRSVPVPDDATDVRAAVLRQDEASGGIRITFDLYRRSLDYLRRERNALPPTILDDLTGDLVTDQKRLSIRIKAETEGVDEETARLLASQIVILVVLKLLQLGVDSIEGGVQSATKQPSGTEVAIIAANLAVSIAAQQIYAGMTEDDIKDALEELGGQMPPVGDMTTAKEALSQMPLFQAGLTALNPTDHRIIVDFVRAFINRQEEPGWETWQLADDLAEQAEWAQDSANALERYVPDNPEEPEASANVELSLGGILNLEADISINPADTVPSDDVSAVYDRALGAVNVQVDRLGQVLGYRPDISDICCFFNWLETLDASVMKTMRNLVDVFQKSLRRIDDQLNVGQFSGNLSMSTTIHQSIMLLLNDVNDRIVSKFKDWFTRDTDRWSELAQCRLIDELLEYMVSALEYLENMFVSFLDRYLGYIEDQEQKFGKRLNVVAQQKHIRTIMSLFDQFAEFSRQSGGICLEEDPTQLAGAVQSVLDNLGPPVAIPTGTGNPFTSIESPPLVLSNGVVIPAPAGQQAGTTVLEAAQEACRLGLVNQNLIPFPRGS